MHTCTVACTGGAGCGAGCGAVCVMAVGEKEGGGGAERGYARRLMGGPGLSPREGGCGVAGRRWAWERAVCQRRGGGRVVSSSRRRPHLPGVEGALVILPHGGGTLVFAFAGVAHALEDGEVDVVGVRGPCEGERAGDREGDGELVARDERGHRRRVCVCVCVCACVASGCARVKSGPLFRIAERSIGHDRRGFPRTRGRIRRTSARQVRESVWIRWMVRELGNWILRFQRGF